MSQWDQNRRPLEQQGQYGYNNDNNNETLFNSSSLLNSMANSFNGQNEFYDQQFVQNYVPITGCDLMLTINESYDSFLNSNQNQTQLANFNNSFLVNNQTMADEYGHMGATSSSQSNNQAGSSTIINSNLTPLAKEFTPSSSSNSTTYYANNTFYDKNKKQGALRKGTSYWNKEKRYGSNKQNYENNDNRYFKPDHDQYKSNSNSYRNTSKEQHRVLQETKRFLEQVKNVAGDDDDSVMRNEVDGNRFYKDDATQSYEKPRVELDAADNKFSKQNNYYGKGSYNNNRNRSNYKNYRRDNNHYENRNRDYQSYDNKKYRNEASSGRYRDVDQKQESSGKYENLRSKIQADMSERKRPDFQNLKKKLDAASQRERLEQLIVRRLLECLVCCEKLKHTDQVWSCKQCFHILHLQCIKRWAQSSKLEAGWRCPACQNVYQEIPNEYRCYCNKQVTPSLEPGGVPHSCGSVCGRKGRSCLHTCTLICHPGPCPDCSVMVPRSCGCGSTKPTVKCSSTVPITCHRTCEKILECGRHKCDKKCHEGDCDGCTEVIKQECYCGKEGRKIKCTSETQGSTYECGDVCEKWLSCGNHKCERNCHFGPCDTCTLAPENITTCCCGQTKLSELRKTCLDPVPRCDKKCNKKLLCGQPSAPHLCQSSCHEGPCPPCSLTTVLRCRCGHMDKELPCVQVTTKADDARCEKKCTKKRLCGRHKCNQFCCIEVDHVCPLICNRLLSCGQHRCEEQCHRGRCPSCWRTSFEELYCECGSSVLYPPVACGTRPPPCDQPCQRPRECGHYVLHNCHTGPCPPCTVLSKRWCHGHHEQRSTIPCYQDNFSCGLPCGRDMICGKHKCVLSCHEGACRNECAQPCSELRPECGHPCNQPCHLPPCPETSCKAMVKVTCQCGLRKSSRVCMELAGEYQNIAMSQLASKMEEMQLGHAVDLTDLINNQKKGSLKTLDCNEECRLVERNRKLAIGLQIRNPDLSSKLTPRYNDYMRTWAKKDPKFCKYVHDKLTELVQLAKQSKQKSRSFSFEIMNRDKRHFVHEYCEHFGCDSAAYDPEPNRNVVATAWKDKSWLPSYSLMEVIQRESGQRKVPGPQQLEKGSASKSEAVSLKLSTRSARPATPPGEYVDYFNNPPE